MQLRRELTSAEVLRRNSDLPEGWLIQMIYTPDYTLEEVSLLATKPYMMIRYTERAEGKDAITIVVNQN